MENPATWGKVRKAIDEALHDYYLSVKNGFIGYSQITYIYNKLREKGFVVEDEPEKK